MGMFDYIEGIAEDSGYQNQVKCWENLMYTYGVGDPVDPVESFETYSIRVEPYYHTRETAEARFITVEDLTITDVFSTEPVPDAPIFDKWGGYLCLGGEDDYQEWKHPFAWKNNGE